MRRVLGTLLLGWVIAVACASPVSAAGGEPDPGSPPDSCFQANADGDLPTCTYDDGQWHPIYPTADDGSFAGFALIVLLAVVVGVGITAYKVSMARDMARKSGMDPGQATAMTLLTDDGLEATYLASNLRPPSEAGGPPEEHEQSPSNGAGERTVSERLAELERLREQGLVTQGEYDERRGAILGSL